MLVYDVKPGVVFTIVSGLDNSTTPFLKLDTKYSSNNAVNMNTYVPCCIDQNEEVISIYEVQIHLINDCK